MSGRPWLWAPLRLPARVRFICFLGKLFIPCDLFLQGQDDLRKKVEELCRSVSTAKSDKVARTLKMVRTLAGKARDPSLVLDAIDELVAAATLAQDDKTEFYKKVLDQSRKHETETADDFGSLVLCLLGDVTDQKIADGLARFNKMKKRVGSTAAAASVTAKHPEAGATATLAPAAPPQPYGWGYQSPLPVYPPDPEGYGYLPPRRGRGRGRGQFQRSRACFFCKQEGHFMDTCAQLKALQGQPKQE